jgi:F-type H+-transporting ATPase subunit b
MKMLNTIRAAGYGLTGAVITTAIAFAEEAGHGGHHEETITFMGDWLPRLVNFSIIAAVVVYYMRKPVRDFFANRTNEIAKAMRESRDARERAEAALAEMENKTKDMQAETDRMIADARARGEKDRQTVIEEGRKIAQDVQAQVKEGIAIEVEKAKAALAAEAVLLSLDLAEGRIKETIGGKDHERIVKEYISKVGGRG